jgi:hypothetical protein
MFGYIRYDKPYLYVKDVDLYQAAYCGVCKAIGSACGQTARMGLSYDSAFFSVLFHNLAGVDMQIEKQTCIKKCGFKKPMAVNDPITEQVACLNSALVYYKLCDDVIDEKKGGVKRLLFLNAAKKVRAKHPAMAETIERYMRLQQQTEGACPSLDAAADATASMVRDVSNYILKEKATEWTEKLFYSIGKWIYLIDGADDYDKDRKKGNFNPFYITYKSKDRATLLAEHGEDIEFCFNTLFFDIRESMANIQFYFNRDLIDNILLRGLPLMTKNILCGECCKKKKKQRKEKQA